MTDAPYMQIGGGCCKVEHCIGSWVCQRTAATSALLAAGKTAAVGGQDSFLGSPLRASLKVHKPDNFFGLILNFCTFFAFNMFKY
jgi:hypothetical protein